jgi:hypothetical protein
LSVESQAAEILDFSALAPLPPFKTSAVSTPEAISRDVVSAACATTDPLAEPPRRSRRIQETIKKKAMASTAAVEDVPVPDKASARHQQCPTRLSRVVKIYLEKIQESLDPETLFSLLESAITYNKSTHHPPLKDGQILLLPHDSWDDVMVASKKEHIRRFGDHLNLKTRSKLTVPTPEETGLMIGEVPDMVFAPFYYQESWIMIQFLITSSCCRTEVYDPSDRLADDKDWKVLKDALRRIFGAVYGPDRKFIVWDGFGRVHREHSPAESRFSGILAVAHASLWMKEYTEALIRNRPFFLKYLRSTSKKAAEEDGIDPECQLLTSEEIPIPKRGWVHFDTLRIELAKMMALYDPHSMDFSDDGEEDLDNGHSGGLVSVTDPESDNFESEFSDDDFESEFSDNDFDFYDDTETESTLDGITNSDENDAVREIDEALPEQFDRATVGSAMDASAERDARDKARRAELLKPAEIDSIMLQLEQVEQFLSLLGPAPENVKTSS